MDHNDSNNSDVITALNHSVGEVSMHATADEIVSVGRARRRRQRGAAVAASAVVLGSVGFALAQGGDGSAPSTTAHGATTKVHIQTAAFVVDSKSDGTVHVTWDKQRYFEDRSALQAALTQAGFPVVIRVGEFCAGPGDDTDLDASGVGPGVENVMRGEDASGGRVEFVFTPSAMPAGKELFIGYLNDAQLAVTHGMPGSVERLVSTGVPLTCTTTAPPAHN